MQVELYKGFIKRKNSTKQPTGLTPVVKDVNLKGECSVLNPSFFLADADSYTYLKAWGNYYFIDRVAYDINGAQYINCSIDVLASYKAAIQGTSAFVRYASTNYDVNIKDPRIQLKSGKTFNYRANSSDLFLSRNHTNEVCILTAQGVTGLRSYVLDEQAVEQLMLEVTLAGREVGTDLQLQFGDALGAIVSCFRLPIEPSMIPSTGPDEIYLGDYNTSYEAAYLYGAYIMERGDVDIPWQYNDFRNLAPFTELYLELPYVGVVSLDPFDFIGEQGVIIQTCVNVRNGHVDYRICSGSVNHVVANFSATCGGDIPIAATQISNPRGVVDNVLQLGKNSLTPTVTGLAGNIKSITDIAMDLQQSDVTIIGSYSGGYCETLNTDYRCIVVTHPTNDDPANFATLYGRPVMKTMSLASLTGYVETEGFSIAVEAIAEVRDLINSAMDRGVYIE